MDEGKEGAAGGAGGEHDGGVMGGGGGGGGSPRGGAGGAGPAGMHYSIPGILHFLQHEWSRFEMERSQWEVEKAELQARIAFLQGERKGQENLKNDLVRRIKMLEYALKQERAKYNKLKYGSDHPAADAAAGGKPPLDGEEGGVAPAPGMDLPPLDADNYISVSNRSWRQGRELLRQYLQEIGYTDTIIDVRSNRVRSLLGLSDANDLNEANSGSCANVAVNGDAKKQAGDGQLLDNEASVMANFDFLSSEAEVDDDDDEVGDGRGGGSGADIHDLKLKNKLQHQEDKDTEEVMNEFNFLSSQDAVDSGFGGKEESSKGLSGNSASDFLTPSSRAVSGSSPVPADKASKESGQLGANLELGELEQLTIANDNESSYDISAPKEAFRKTWTAKYTLRSHFDGVRALAFHPTEPILVTASEDQTLKLWNLQKTIPAKKSASLDVEPVYTFRGHRGPVLALTVASTGEALFSGGLDGTVRCWAMPPPSVDPYDSFEPGVLTATLGAPAHADAVWALRHHAPRAQLLSCSSDGTVKLWSTARRALLSTVVEDAEASPTSVDWVYEEPSHALVARASGACAIHDLETGKPLVHLDTTANSGEPSCISRVVSHPTLPLTITAHEDRQIRFFDNNTGKMTHAMVAHLDAVTSLSVDSNGLYLISGSHDCSVRLWNLETKTCVQEITAHRKKFDESILDVAFHASKPFIASAGADALAKVFV